MNELTRVLWDYAREYRLDTCHQKEDRDNRRDAVQMVERTMEKFRETCPKELAERLDILWDELEEIRSDDMAAAFACGLHVGLSLR